MGLSKSTEFRTRIQQWTAMINKQANYHSLELPDGTVIEGIIPISALRARLEDLSVPKDLKGSAFRMLELHRAGIVLN